VKTVPLIVILAFINDYFNGHEPLLQRIKVRQQALQAERDTREIAKNEENESKEGGNADNVPSHEDAQLRSFQLYQLSLDTAITSSSKNHFPICLFGRAISTTLISTWLAAFAYVLYQKGSSMAVPVLADWCERFGSAFAQNATESFVDFADLNHAVNITDFNFTQVFSEMFCRPMLMMAIQSTSSKIVEGEAWPGLGSQARRLASRAKKMHEGRGPLSVRAALEAWWDGHPGDPEAKLLLARHALRALARDARRLLARTPQSVLEALRRHGPEVAYERALATYREHGGGDEEGSEYGSEGEDSVGGVGALGLRSEL